jgi:tetratricopeptide (TPR) repeat protein
MTLTASLTEFWTASEKPWKTPMRVREKIEAIHIILLVAGLALFGGFLFIAVYFLKTENYSRSLDYSLESVDALIQASGYEEARKIIEGLEGFPVYTGDWLRLLKRCRLLAEKTGKPEIFSLTALRAQKANPDNIEIAAVAAIALIDAGMPEEALFLAEKFEDLDFRSVAAEIFVRSSAPPPAERPGELVYAFLPESGDFRDYLMAGGLAEGVLGPAHPAVQGFFRNAALLLLERGEGAAALEILDEHGAGGDPFLAALAAYDAGKFGESDKYWDMLPPERKMDPRPLALRADSFLRQRRYAESKNIYEIFFYNFPDYSPIPYQTMNFLLHRETPSSGTKALQRGLELFPQDFPLLLDYAKTLVRENRAAGGEELADRIFSGLSAADTNRGPEEMDTAADSRVLALLARRADIPAGRLVSQLWMLHNDYPDSASVLALLRWHLFSLADHAGMRLLLAGQTARNEPYTGSYLAALDFSEGAFDSALRELSGETELFPLYPEGFYNLGLVYSHLGRREDALAAFAQARQATEYALLEDMEERVCLWEFETLKALNRLPEAVALLREFLEKYPGHPEALRRLRKLEARRE